MWKKIFNIIRRREFSGLTGLRAAVFVCAGSPFRVNSGSTDVLRPRPIHTQLRKSAPECQVLG